MPRMVGSLNTVWLILNDLTLISNINEVLKVLLVLLILIEYFEYSPIAS